MKGTRHAHGWTNDDFILARCAGCSSDAYWRILQGCCFPVPVDVYAWEQV